MIYRLIYCNKDGVEARVDIQKGLATPVIDVEGTERPFILSYNNDKGDKSGMFLSSSADIEIYETTDFNIDNLKTSNETELAVTYYINNIVKWKGFIIPDFFSIEVRSNPVIVMTASDRLGTLKSVTLSDLPTMVNIRELAVSCLNKTGLTLPLKTMADFSNDDTDNAFFSYYVDSQRIKDIKGRSISCYDILSSILIASNSKLVQRAGEWVIINKLQHETGSGKIYSSLSSFTNYLENIYNFDEVSIGARRTIMPVAGSVGIYHEHGGRKSHPANYDFSLGLSGWNSVNGFVATIENRHIIGFLGGTPLFDTERTVKQYLLNYNNWIDDTNNLNTAPYISTDAIPINSPRADRVEVTVDISSTMAEKLSSNTAMSFLRYAVTLTNGVKTYTLTKAGVFEELDPENISGHSLLLRGGQQSPLLLASPALSNSESFKGLFEVGEDDDVNNYSATIRVYGSGDQYVTVNYALIKFSDVSELPKGTMYKTEQGEVFTKAYDIETSIFGDYLLSGLDGYFYRYPNDDTSSIYKDVNTLSSPIWTTPMIPSETSELPLLHHSMRQMRRIFSVAHDLLSAELEVNNFDPLAIFVACEKRHTVVSAQFDFFKSNLSVELEEVAFQNATVRDFIYSYFGDGESGIKSIGGISGGTGGGGGAGGGLTPEQLEILSWWKKDPDNPNTIFTEMNAYSKLEISAYGAGSGGGGGGGGSDYERLDTWADYDSSKSGWVLSALLGNDLNTRVTDLENSGGGGGGSTVEWGTLTNGYRQLTVEGVTYALAQNTHKHLWADITDKPSTFTPSAHTHSAGDITSGTFAIARIPTGTTSGTVAQGNDSRIINGQTAFGWGNHSGLYLPLTGGTMANTNLVTNLNADLLDGLHKTAFAQQFHAALGTNTGWYKIRILSTASWMIAFNVRIYQGYQFYEIMFSGYNYGTNYWHRPQARLVTSTGTNIQAHFGYDSARNLWVAVPAGPYTGLSIVPVTNGGSQGGDWSNNFSVTAEATLTGTIQSTQNLQRPLYRDENAVSATKLQTPRTIWGQSFDGSGNVSGALAINLGGSASYPLSLTSAGVKTNIGSLNSTWCHFNTTATTGFYFYKNIRTPLDVTARYFIGALTGNADTATTATKLGTATVGSTQLPFYLNAGTATAITQANLRIGLFGATAIGSSTQPVHIAANGIATACTSFGGVTGIGTASPLMDGTVAVGTSTLAARQDHRHPVDTSRAAVGQTMYIGTTAVTINRASATLNLTGIGTLAMAGALSGATTIAASISVTTPKVIFAAAGWSVEQSGTEVQFKYNGVIKQRLLSDGSIVGIGEITAFGSTV
jgi:hypothetical protein